MTIFIPEEKLSQRYRGPLYGVRFDGEGGSGNVNIVPDALAHSNPALYVELGGLSWRGEGEGAEPLFSFCGEEELPELKPYSLVADVFSRNSGILESSLLLGKHAVILGCGSVGSLVALELARSGVGRFTLIDNDVLEYHNIGRHQCSIRDVGDYKVNALKRRILEINPTAQVSAHVSVIENLTQGDFAGTTQEDSILVGCADNRPADVYANSIAALYKAPFVSVGCWHRAFAGAVFYWLPGMPCYYCALGDGGDLTDLRPDVSRRFYVGEEHAAELQFEPGIAADIDFVTLVGVKLALDLLCRNATGYTPRLLGHLAQYTLICNTNRTEVGGEMAEIFSYPLQVTTSLKTTFRGSCPPCQYE